MLNEIELAVHFNVAKFIRMFTKIWRWLCRPFHVANCVDALLAGKLEAAKKYYSRFDDSIRPRHLALGGRLKLAEREYESAKKYLEKAANAASQKSDKRHKYILEYCNFYLSLLMKDGRHEEHREAAHSLKPSRLLLNMLPLAPKDWEQRQGTSNEKPAPKFKYTASKSDYSMDGSIDFNFDDN